MAVSRLAGAVEGMPRLLLRLEGAALAIGAVYLYQRIGANWWLFAALILRRPRSGRLEGWPTGHGSRRAAAPRSSP